MARITVVLVVLAAVALSAQSPAVTVLPITRVVLYKSGIGFFEHVTTVTGNQALAVQFTGDQLDDVLKSLTAVDLGSGRVAGISYDSPTPSERRLRALRVPLAPDADSIQMLQALRGARVEVRTGSGIATTGRVLQAERRTRARGNGPPAEQDELTVVSDGGEIATRSGRPITAWCFPQPASGRRSSRGGPSWITSVRPTGTTSSYRSWPGRRKPSAKRCRRRCS